MRNMMSAVESSQTINSILYLIVFALPNPVLTSFYHFFITFTTIIVLTARIVVKDSTTSASNFIQICLMVLKFNRLDRRTYRHYQTITMNKTYRNWKFREILSCVWTEKQHGSFAHQLSPADNAEYQHVKLYPLVIKFLPVPIGFTTAQSSSSCGLGCTVTWNYLQRRLLQNPVAGKIVADKILYETACQI